MGDNSRPELVLPDDFKDPALPKEYFSHSQYGMAKRCMKQYEFRYVRDLVRPPEVAMVGGIAVHAGSEYTLNKKINGEDTSLEEALDHVSDKYQSFEDDVDDLAEFSESKDSTLDAYKVFHLTAVPNIDPIAVEEPFQIKVGDVPVLGYMDIVFTLDGLKAVSDVKVSKKSWSQDNVDRSTQLTLYGKAAQTPDVCIDQVVRGKRGAKYKRIQSVRGTRDWEIFEEDLNETVDLIKAGLFPKTSIDDWACTPRWCGYWHLCRGRKK